MVALPIVAIICNTTSILKGARMTQTQPQKIANQKPGLTTKSREYPSANCFHYFSSPELFKPRAHCHLTHLQNEIAAAMHQAVQERHLFTTSDLI